MTSRFPHTPVLDYCFSPVHIKDQYRDILVPCGKCDGCRLHKANEWSMRLVDEIENCPNTIFFTLTYNNYFLPKLMLTNVDCDDHGYVYNTFISDHSDNIRHNSVDVVVRSENLVIKTPESSIPIQHSDYVGLAYASKVDVQLWLKILRKKLFERFYIWYQNEDRKNRGFFRYYIISEYGPTTYRPHYHGLLFPKKREFAECLIEECLYQSWQMCDEGLFKQYTHYCNSGVSQYVTNYTTGFANLPKVYQQNKEIRPFRLSSRSPAIGYKFYDKTEVFESIFRGDCSYTKSITRLGNSFVFKYSKDFVSSLFPKCYRYGLVSPERIYFVYGCLLRSYSVIGLGFDRLSFLLRQILHQSDYAAAYAAYKYCTSYRSCLEHYLYLLDSFYYHYEMAALNYHFSWLEQHHDILELSRYYINFADFVRCSQDGIGFYPLTMWYFLDSFGFTWNDLYSLFPHIVRNNLDPNRNIYIDEVSSIITSSTKMSKFNEISGNSPHIV